jgi:hypothetical protein
MYLRDTHFVQIYDKTASSIAQVATTSSSSSSSSSI